MGQLNLYKRIFYGPLRVVVSEPKKSHFEQIFSFSLQQINLTNFSTVNRNQGIIQKQRHQKKLHFLDLHTPLPHQSLSPFPHLSSCHYFLLSMYYDATYMHFNLLLSSGSDMLLRIFGGRIKICSQAKHIKFCCVAH